MFLEFKITHVTKGSLRKTDKRRKMFSSELFTSPQNRAISSQSNNVIYVFPYIFTCIYKNLGHIILTA